MKSLPVLEAEEEMHLREATRVAGKTTLLAAVFKENMLKYEKRICQKEERKKKSRPFIYPGSPQLTKSQRGKSELLLYAAFKVLHF